MAAMSKEEILPFSFFPPCTAFTTNETLVESVLERESNPRPIDYESIALSRMSYPFWWRCQESNLNNFSRNTANTFSFLAAAYLKPIKFGETPR